jgi:very-short-patch-repair endonuclease
MRKNMTPAEQRLWRHLRSRQICGVKFRRQVPIEDFIVDFACIEARIIVEVDGGQHNENVDYDAMRDKQLRHAGFETLRFWNNDVMANIEGVVESIRLVVKRRAPHPDLPPPAGEGA